MIATESRTLTRRGIVLYGQLYSCPNIDPGTRVTVEIHDRGVFVISPAGKRARLSPKKYGEGSSASEPVSHNREHKGRRRCTPMRFRSLRT